MVQSAHRSRTEKMVYAEHLPQSRAFHLFLLINESLSCISEGFSHASTLFPDGDDECSCAEPAESQEERSPSSYHFS